MLEKEINTFALMKFNSLHCEKFYFTSAEKLNDLIKKRRIQKKKVVLLNQSSVSLIQNSNMSLIDNYNQIHSRQFIK